MRGMDKSWKIFCSESGICSLENRTLEERSFYRMKVFLRNFYREQYREEKKENETVQKSFLYTLALNLHGKDAKKEVQAGINQNRDHAANNSCSLEFFVARKKFLLTWDAVLGLVITAVDTTGNDVITRLNEALVNEECSWF